MFDQMFFENVGAITLPKLSLTKIRLAASNKIVFHESGGDRAEKTLP
jgi:hypothetical protein